MTAMYSVCIRRVRPRDDRPASSVLMTVFGSLIQRGGFFRQNAWSRRCYAQALWIGAHSGAARQSHRGTLTVEVSDVGTALRFRQDIASPVASVQPQWSHPCRTARRTIRACQPFAHNGRSLGAASHSLVVSLRFKRQNRLERAEILIYRVESLKSSSLAPSRESHGQQNAHRCIASGRNPRRRCSRKPR